MTATQATIEADERLPVIRITRDFAATAAQLLAAHTDPEAVRAVGRTGRHGDRDLHLGCA
jgi:hypothetical protein